MATNEERGAKPDQPSPVPKQFDDELDEELDDQVAADEAADIGDEDAAAARDAGAGRIPRP